MPESDMFFPTLARRKNIPPNSTVRIMSTATTNKKSDKIAWGGVSTPTRTRLRSVARDNGTGFTSVKESTHNHHFVNAQPIVSVMSWVQ